MSKHQLVQSLKDTLPTFSGDFPPQLLSYVDSLYLLSHQQLPVLPNRGEVARYHLCAYLGVERCQERLKLPIPLAQKIPLQPKIAEKLLQDLRLLVVKSPASSPRKRVQTPTSSPSKRQNAPIVGSPLKRLRVAEDLGSDTLPAGNGKLTVKAENEESPFLSKSGVESPFMTKLTNSMDAPKTPTRSPKKSKLSAASTPNSPRYIRQLSIADFISFANNFYIPATVTPHILEFFMSQRYKFAKKNEWFLACGLIYAAYIRINDRIMVSAVKKTELQDQLFQYQKGGLGKQNMVMWLNIIEESVKTEAWIMDLELKYVHNNWTPEDTTREKEIEAKLGRGYELLLDFGSMISPSHMFNKASQKKYYEVWTKRLLEELDNSQEK